MKPACINGGHRILASLDDGSRGRLRPHAPEGDGRSFCLHKNSSTATRSPLGEGASRAPRSWCVAGMQSRPVPPSGREVSCVSMTEGARATLKSSHFIVHAHSSTRASTGAPSRREPLMRPAMRAFPLGEGASRAPRSWCVAGMQSRPVPPSGREVSYVSMTEGARATLRSSHFIVHAHFSTRASTGAPSGREPLMRPAVGAFPLGLEGEGVAEQATNEGVFAVLAYRGERSFYRYEKTHVAV